MSVETSQMEVGAGLATQTTPANENLVCSALWYICFNADKWPQHFRKVVTVKDVLESFLPLPSGLCLEVIVWRLPIWLWRRLWGYLYGRAL